MRRGLQMEVLLPLPGIDFRFRLDRVSQEAQARLLYDLVYLPLLGIVNAAQHSHQDGLHSLQHVSGDISCCSMILTGPHPIIGQAIDQESKAKTTAATMELLSAMQRFSQGTSGVPLKSRGMCSSHL